MLWGEVGGCLIYRMGRGRNEMLLFLLLFCVSCVFYFCFNVIYHFASPAFTFRDWSGTRVRTHYMVHRSALLVIFSSLSSRLEFDITAHSYFVSFFDTAPATIFKLKKNGSCYSCNKQYPKTPNFTSGSHH